MESQVVDESVVEDKLKGLCWKTKEGELIPVSEMRDPHLRNAALFLMGFGYSICIASKERKIIWLTILRTEWERRMIGREVDEVGKGGPPAKATFTKTRQLKG